MPWGPIIEVLDHRLEVKNGSHDFQEPKRSMRDQLLKQIDTLRILKAQKEGQEIGKNESKGLMGKKLFPKVK